MMRYSQVMRKLGITNTSKMKEICLKNGIEIIKIKFALYIQDHDFPKIKEIIDNRKERIREVKQERLKLEERIALASSLKQQGLCLFSCKELD